MKKYDYNIIGAGAMGHLWACSLLGAGFESSLYCREPRPRQKIELISGASHSIQTVDYGTLIQWQQARVVMICVKAHQLEALCQQLSSLVRDDSTVILMMNGLGLIEICRRYLPSVTILHASITHGAYLEAGPQGQRLIHTGTGETLLGNLRTDYDPLQFNELIQQLDRALASARWNPEHQQSMHLKLVINAIINPLTALSGLANGSILQNARLNPAAQALLFELSPLLKLILPRLTISQVKRNIEKIAADTHANLSSMLQDVRAGKKTEIEHINGYLIKLAGQHQIELPQHARIVQDIKALAPQF